MVSLGQNELNHYPGVCSWLCITVLCFRSAIWRVSRLTRLADWTCPEAACWMSRPDQTAWRSHQEIQVRVWNYTIINHGSYMVKFPFFCILMGWYVPVTCLLTWLMENIYISFVLTPWGMKKMAGNLLATFWNEFKKKSILTPNFTEICS